MKCPKCTSTQIRKNGRPNGRQRYGCKACGKQFFEALPVQAQSLAESDALQEAAAAALTVPSQQQGIAILLLDAENLKLDINAEKYLASLSVCPLQGKMAFANWRSPSLGKQDTELYDRGYQLIHVPGGANSADAKMIAVGASIRLQYPSVKEIFVCSSDGLLNHLCNHLQNQGLTVYRVSRKDKNLTVENRSTGEIKHYSVSMDAELPSLESLVKQVEELIAAENDATASRLERLSAVAALFQERSHLATPPHSSPSIENKDDSFSPVVEDSPAAAIASNADSLAVSDAPDITSLDILETILVKMIEKMGQDSGGNSVFVSHLKTRFQAHYNKTADACVKKFNPKSSLVKFLESRPALFKLTLIGNDYQVAIAPPASPKLQSPSDLEQALVKILQTSTANQPGSYTSLSNLSGEFHKHYGQPITTIMTELQLGKKFLAFLQNCKAFKLKKTGKNYQIALR